eukprot:3746413-Pleurochrysis_carterae.AAC.1
MLYTNRGGVKRAHRAAGSGLLCRGQPRWRPSGRAAQRGALRCPKHQREYASGKWYRNATDVD